jgi:hypothetical protein
MLLLLLSLLILFLLLLQSVAVANGFEGTTLLPLIKLDSCVSAEAESDGVKYFNNDVEVGSFTSVSTVDAESDEVEAFIDDVG